MNDLLEDYSQPQSDRLAFIDLKLRFIGELRRQDLVSRFGIQMAAATRDIALYKKIAPRNIAYNTNTKTYAPGDWFVPVFEFTSARILAWLAHGFGEGQHGQLKALIPCESPPYLNEPDLNIISVITRAIYKQQAVEISYRAMTSGLTTRAIVPFALADNGFRWHVRAFDRKTGEFRDFVLTRVVEARPTELLARDHEQPSQDIQWNRIVELELVPHPANVRHPDTIEMDFGMRNGFLSVQVRAALAGYMLRRWNVDCSETHSLRGVPYHLWLRNRETLYGVANLELAPGYTTGIQRL